MKRVIRTIEGDTADAIAWRYYGEVPGALEAILKANTHLAAQGTVLPMGLCIELPDISAPAAPLLQLWPAP